MQYLSLCFLGFFSVLLSQNATAQLAQNLMIGNPKALALGHAVTADPPGIDSIHFNPAGLARLKGRQRELKIIAADASITAEFTSTEEFDALQEETGIYDSVANTESDINSFAAYIPGAGFTELPVTVAPLGGISVQKPGSNVTFATGVYAPFMMGMARDDDDPGRFVGRELAITRLTYFSPSIGVQMTETFAVGVSVGFSYVGVGIDLDFRASNYGLARTQGMFNEICANEDPDSLPINVCGGEINPYETLINMQMDLNNPFSLTMNVGFLWDVTPWFTVGMVWQSPSTDKVEGDLVMTYSDGLIGFTEGVSETIDIPAQAKVIETKGSTEIETAQHIALGVSLQLLPDIKVNVDLKWTETSVWDELVFELDEPDPMLGIMGNFIEGIEEDKLIFPRGYENSMNWAIGIEYAYSDVLALRVGYEPRKSGIPEDKRDFFLPIGDMDLYAIGFSYLPDSTSVFDVSLGYAKSVQDIPVGSSTNGNDTRADNFLYNPYAGLDVKTELSMVMLELSYRSEF
ncbi:hypothetical protein A9Q99_16875 [Gammaproteobacteria bacterium 45_16_T64]|mgnify:CR=1 FL=1|nr:hypothetical protein A9Q99_16875 [Gammaproteobacteria bacterium 45_16_T64]